MKTLEEGLANLSLGYSEPYEVSWICYDERRGQSPSVGHSEPKASRKNYQNPNRGVIRKTVKMHKEMKAVLMKSCEMGRSERRTARLKI